MRCRSVQDVPPWAGGARSRRSRRARPLARGDAARVAGPATALAAQSAASGRGTRRGAVCRPERARWPPRPPGPLQPIGQRGTPRVAPPASIRCRRPDAPRPDARRADASWTRCAPDSARSRPDSTCAGSSARSRVADTAQSARRAGTPGAATAGCRAKPLDQQCGEYRASPPAASLQRTGLRRSPLAPNPGVAPPGRPCATWSSATEVRERRRPMPGAPPGRVSALGVSARGVRSVASRAGHAIRRGES